MSEGPDHPDYPFLSLLSVLQMDGLVYTPGLDQKHDSFFQPDQIISSTFIHRQH